MSALRTHEIRSVGNHYTVTNGLIEESGTIYPFRHLWPSMLILLLDVRQFNILQRRLMTEVLTLLRRGELTAEKLML